MSFAAARENMVDSQVRTSDVTDPHIQAAMRALPRERFCAGSAAALAYADREAPIAEGRALMTPRDLAKLLQALAPRPGERALVICEPYAAAVLARIGCAVTAIDTSAAAAVVADVLAEEGVAILAGDPAGDLPDGEFDLVLVGGAVADPPVAWTSALAEGGRAGLVIRKGALGRAWIFAKANGRASGRPVFECAPSWLPGLEPKAAFVF